MKCSHGLPFEQKCQGCFQDAISRLRTMLSAPPPEASKEQKEAFWAQQYRQSQLPA